MSGAPSRRLGDRPHSPTVSAASWRQPWTSRRSCRALVVVAFARAARRSGTLLSRGRGLLGSGAVRVVRPPNLPSDLLASLDTESATFSMVLATSLAAVVTVIGGLLDLDRGLAGSRRRATGLRCGSGDLVHRSLVERWFLIRSTSFSPRVAISSPWSRRPSSPRRVAASRLAHEEPPSRLAASRLRRSALNLLDELPAASRAQAGEVSEVMRQRRSRTFVAASRTFSTAGRRADGHGDQCPR